MNIWILNHYAVSPNSIGGTRHFDLAEELVSKGHKVRIFASSFNHFIKEETIQFNKSTYREENINDVFFTWIKTPPYNSSVMRILNISLFTLNLYKVLKKYVKTEKPDLIIGSSVHPLTAIVGKKIAEDIDCLFYFEERDLWPQTFIDFGLISEKHIIAKMLFSMEKKLYQKSNRVIFLFERAHEYAINKGLPNNKYMYLPNGFSSQRINRIKKNEEVDGILAGLKGKKIVTYTGSMGEANHMDPLFDLAKSMVNNPDFHFLFFGSGPKKSEFKIRVKEELITNVDIVNPIPKDAIPYLLENSSYGMISMKKTPLYKWGFSMNKIYDYLAMGLPIIMYTDLEDIGTINKSNAIIKSNGIIDLKKALINGQTFDSEKIKEFTHRNYSWSVLAETLIEYVEFDLKQKSERKK